MLKQIRIRNFIFIEKANLDLHKGLNVLSGETGAGKSIFLGAMGITLGGKVSAEYIKPGSDSLKVTTVFDISTDPEIKKMLEELDIDTEEELLTLRREISLDGKSRCYINNNLTNISSLKNIGGYLLDIHSQHETGKLYNENTHIRYYDRFLKVEEILNEYKSAFKKWNEARNHYESLLAEEQATNKEKDFLDFTIKELKGKLISQEEYDAAKNQIKQFASKEQAISSLQNCDTALTESRSHFETALIHLRKASGADPSLENIYTKAEALTYELSELQSSFADFFSGENYKTIDVDQLNEKLAATERLRKKYGATIDDLFDKLSAAEKKREFLDTVQIEKKEATRAVENSFAASLAIAKKLSEIRNSRKNDFLNLLKEELAFLEMKGASFSIEIIPLVKGQNPLSSDSLADSGLEKIRFLYQSAKEAPFKPLKEIASGGEASRIMLALKKVLLETLTANTLILDEIDTGIGGKTAIHVGRKIKEISSDVQVVVITHLAQIAKYADRHFLVQKTSAENEPTLTSITTLSEEERGHEISRMLSGETITDANESFVNSFLNSN